jgi:hypothetical protein
MCPLIVAFVVLPFLAAPALIMLAVKEASVPSPVFFDLASCSFQRHKLAAQPQPDSPPVSEDEALLALVVQRSLDEQSGTPEGSEANATTSAQEGS